MARIVVDGTELLTAAGPEGSINQGASKGRRPSGIGWEAANSLQATGTAHSNVHTFGTNKNHFWFREDIYIIAYPGASHRRVIGGQGSVEGTDNSWYLTVGDDGKLYGYNKGNGAKTQIGVSTKVLALNTHYRLNVEIQFRVAGSAKFDVKIDGSITDGFTGSGFGTTNGLGHGSQVGVNITHGSSTGNEVDGGAVVQDDLVADDTTEPAAGGVTLIQVSGPGTYDNWATGGSWRSVVNRLPSDGTAPLSHTTTTASLTQTYALESMTSRGVPSGATIRSVRLAFRGALPRTNWAYRLRQNGTDNDSALQAAEATTNWKRAPATQQGLGWFIDRGTLAIAPADTLEIGIVDGTGAGTSALSGAYLIVDWEGTEPTLATENGDIVIELGTFVGNGTTKDVNFTNPTLAPTFLWILAQTAAGQSSRAWWTRGMGYFGAYAQGASRHDNSASGICRVGTASFSVKGAASSINESGATSRYLAIRDNTGRMISTGRRTLNGADNNVDNINVSLEDASFVIEALIVCGQRWGNSGSSNLAYRDTDYGADSSSPLDTSAAAAANLIQSHGTGTFQLGQSGISRTPAFNTTWAAFRTTQFATKRLLTIGSYVGDAAGSRVIPYTALGVTPALVIVIPENANTRQYRTFSDGAGTTSRSWLDGTTSTTSITAFDTADQFTVGANLNTSAVRFHYLVFGSGTDLAPDEIELPADGIGLTWVEVTTRDAALYVWSKVALPDPSTYFGGYKEDRVLRWGVLSRALSDRDGQFEAADFDWVVSDTDRLLRTLLSQDTTKYFKNSPVVVRMIDDPNRRLLKIPRTVIRGYVSDYRPAPGLQFSFKAKDVLSARFSAAGELPARVPVRTIQLPDFPHADDPLVQQTSAIVETVGAVGKGVPIIYGSVNDQTLVDVQVPDIPPVDPDTTFHQGGQNATDRSGAGTVNGWCLAYILPFRAGKLGRILNLSAGTFDFNRAVAFRWATVAGAESYYVFVFDAGDYNPFGGAGSATYARLFIHDLTETYPGDERPFEQLFTATTDGSDVLTPGSTVVQVDQGKGAIIPIYVGDYTISGSVWKGALVCGHAVKSIVAGYLNDKPVDLATDPDWLTPNNAAAWAAAGFTTSYQDINGNRYTIIYLKGIAGETLAGNLAPASGSPGVTLNIDGIEDVGDGSGTLISNIHRQYLHAIQNWILQTYLAGAWLGTPAFEDDPTLKQVNEGSFDACEAIGIQRIGANGYIGAGIIGADGETITIRDLIAQLNVSADADSGFNRKCQFLISMVDDSIASLLSATPLTDVLNIYGGTFDVSDDLVAHANQIEFFYKRDHAGRNPTNWLSTDTIQDNPSITNYTRGNISGLKKAPDLLLWFLRDATSAIDVAYRRLMRQKDPPRIVRLGVGLVGMNYELGQVLSLSHYEGVGPSGWAGQPVRVLRHEADPDKFQVELECYDMQQLFSGAFILGDETVLPASWTSATTAQKNYGYLCDEVTGKFSDGRPGKRLR